MIRRRPGIPSRATRLALTLLPALLAAGCGIGEGGMGLPAQRHGETYPGVRQLIRGTLEVAGNGCLDLVIDGTPQFVIWPAGSELDDRVRLPDGSVIAEGDTVVAIGTRTPTPRLVAPTGYWTQVLVYCAPGEMEVLVLDIAGRTTRD